MLMWKLRDSSVYLVGSLEICNRRPPFSPEMLAAIQRVDTVVFDADTQVTPDSSILELTHPEKLSEIIDGELLSRLQERWAEAGFRGDTFEPMLPIAACLTLVQIECAGAGISPEHGIDGAILELSLKQNKRIVFLETLKEQLSTLASFPLDEQVTLLKRAVLYKGHTTIEVLRMTESWISGDLAVFEEIDARKTKESPVGHRMLVTDRNHVWLEPIAAAARNDSPTLFVFGAIHFVGESGLLRLLAAAGFDAKPVS